MDKIKTDIEIVELKTRWGLVTVLNPQGKFDREFEITSEEAEAVKNGNNILPPGVTQEEWEEGRVISTTRPLLQNMAIVYDDGSLIVNYRKEIINGRIEVAIVKIPEGDWLNDTDGKALIKSSIVESLNLKLYGSSI